MALATCLSAVRSSELSRARVPVTPSQQCRSSRHAPLVVCSTKRDSAPLVAVSVAAVASSILLPVDPTLVTAPASLALTAQEQSVSAPDLLSQLSLTSEKAPVLGFLADEEELTPAERARQLAAEYKRRKEEELAAKAAAAAAAAAEEQARLAPVEEVKAAPKSSSGFFGSRVEEPAAAPALSAQKQEETKVVKKGSKRGGMPLFVSQFGILAAYSGIVAAAFVVPKSEWEKIEKKVEEIGEKVAPIVEEYIEKSKPVLEQAKLKGSEFLEEAKPVVAKAIETATPVVAEAVEKAVDAAKPLVAQAQEAVAAQVNNVMSSKPEEEKPSTPTNGAPKVTVTTTVEKSTSPSSQSEAKL